MILATYKNNPQSTAPTTTTNILIYSYSVLTV